MILLQLSEVGGTIVWQELWACLFVFQLGIVLTLVTQAILRLLRKSASLEDEIARLKKEEKCHVNR